MMRISQISIVALLGILMLTSSCSSKKRIADMQLQLDAANKEVGVIGEELMNTNLKLDNCLKDKERLMNDVTKTESQKQEQINDLRAQIADLKSLRDKQLNTVDDLTKMSQSANDNIKETLSQLESKDKYINLLQAVKTRTDSINLALAVNLKSALRDGLADDDIEVKVDKTVVFVNLSDKMLYQSGSSLINPQAKSVLGKIAEIIKSRPGLEVMVEGYTDNVPMRSSCIEDNWDLSVKRATSVVRVLQKDYGIDPNRLIAAGRGEYNTLATNDTAEGRSTNRRTRIIILPKLNEFYDLLNPDNSPEK